MGCQTLIDENAGIQQTIVGTIMSIREQLHRQSKVDGSESALYKLLTPMMKPGTCLPISAKNFSSIMAFKVLDRVLCQHCFALAVGMLNVNHVARVRYTHTWDNVRAALCRGIHVSQNMSTKLSKEGRVISEKQSVIDIESKASTYSMAETKMLLWLDKFLTNGYGEISPVDGHWHAQYCTKKLVLKEYNETCVLRGLPDEQMPAERFSETMRKLRHVPFTPPGKQLRMLIHWSKWHAFGKCTYCMTLIMNIKKTLRPDLRGAWLTQLRYHRQDAYNEKLFYYESRERALRDMFHICSGQDNLDKAKTRMINFGSFLKGHGADDVMVLNATLGVVTVAGAGHFFYLADATIPDNSNLSIEMLHLTLMQLEDLRVADANKKGYSAPCIATFDNQVDGCRVNKNKTKFAYEAWLVHTKQVGKAADNYMLVGHTHDLMDAVLAVVSRKIKEGLVIKTLQDLADAVMLAFAESKIYVTVTVLHAVHNWADFFYGFVPPIEKTAAHVPDIERPHRHCFDPVVCFATAYVS